MGGSCYFPVDKSEKVLYTISVLTLLVHLVNKGTVRENRKVQWNMQGRDGRIYDRN